MNEVMIPSVESEKITKAESWAMALQIMTPEDHSRAMTGLKGIKEVMGNVVAFFKPSKTAAKEARAQICANEKAFLSRLENAERIAKQAIMTYQIVQDEKRQAEQRRLQAIADEQARRERERLEKQAAKLKTPEKREALLEQAAQVIAPVISVASNVEAQGSSIRKTWKARIINRDLIPREYMEPNMKAIEAFGRATKGAVPVAGIEWFEESGLSVRK